MRRRYVIDWTRVPEALALTASLAALIAVSLGKI